MLQFAFNPGLARVNQPTETTCTECVQEVTFCSSIRVHVH